MIVDDPFVGPGDINDLDSLLEKAKKKLWTSVSGFYSGRRPMMNYAF